jgi:hypothetical protein
VSWNPDLTEGLTQWFVPGIGYVKCEVRMKIAGHQLTHNIGTLEKSKRARTR